MAFLSRLPGLVVLRPCDGCSKRTGPRQRSIVERLICNKSIFVCSVRRNSPHRSRPSPSPAGMAVVASSRSARILPRSAPTPPPLHPGRSCGNRVSCHSAEADHVSGSGSHIYDGSSLQLQIHPIWLPSRISLLLDISDGSLLITLACCVDSSCSPPALQKLLP